jgi:hypothetical protein
LNVPDVPAICRACGGVFPSGIFVENSRDITFTGCTAGPCPRCGGTGEIPDGVYDFVGEAMRVIAAPRYSRERLVRIAAILAQARQSGAPAAQIVAALEDEAPELSDLARRLLVPRTPAELAGFLVVLLMVVQIYLMAKPPSQPTEAELNRMAEQAVERAIEQPAHRAHDARERLTAKRPPPPPRKLERARKARKRR